MGLSLASEVEDGEQQPGGMAVGDNADKRTFQDRELWRLFPEAISPLVHDLNNSLLVLTGVVEFPSSDLVAMARREVEKLRIVLAHLSILSKPDIPRKAGRRAVARVFDLTSMLQAIEGMLRPLASGIGIDLRIPPPTRSTILKGQANSFERMLLLATLAELLAMRDAGLGRELGQDSDEPHRCSLRLRRRPGKAVLYLTRSREKSGERGAAELLARVFREAECLSMEVALRPLRNAIAYRFDLSASLEEDACTSERFVGSLLLVQPEGEERQALAEFLASEGFQVETLNRVTDPERLQGAGTDLVLIDSMLLEASPAVHLALAADALLRASTLILGTLSVSGRASLPAVDGPSSIAEPFRPDDLLAVLRVQLKDAARRRSAAGARSSLSAGFGPG